MPAELRDAIADAAKANNRSMNAEIVARLEQSLARESRMKVSWYADTPSPDVLAEIERRAAEWGCSKTQALIRMTLEEVGRR